MDAKRAKTKAARERRQERVQQKRQAQLGRGVSTGYHDEHLAWVFSRLKEGVILLFIWAYAVMFHVTSVKDSSLHAYSTDKAAPALITDAMSVPKREMSIGIRNQ